MTPNPALGSQMQMNLCESSLVYRESSRTARAEKNLSKKKSKTNQPNKKIPHTQKQNLPKHKKTKTTPPKQQDRKLYVNLDFVIELDFQV